MNTTAITYNNKKIHTVLFLIIFISIFLLQNYLFIQQDKSTGFTDAHITSAAIFYDTMVLKNENNLSRIHYPPLLYLLTALNFRLTGISIQGARMVVSFFAIIFLLAMFGIGYQLGGYHSGAAVMALAISSPHILNYSRNYFPDFPQTAMTALAFYFLLKSEGYNHRLPAILTGVTLALSFMIKWSTAFFMIIPVLWFFMPVIIKPGKYLNQYIIFIITSIFAITGSGYFFKISAIPMYHSDFRWLKYFVLFIILPCIICVTSMYFAEKREKNNDEYLSSSFRKLFNFTLMGSIFLIISLPWYYWNAWGIITKLQAISKDIVNFHQKAYYIIGFLKTSFSLFPIFPIFPIIGLFVIFFSYKKGLFRNLILPVNILFILLLMMKILCPGNRYLLSIIIFASALGGFWVSGTGRFKWIITPFVLLISLLSILSWIIFPGISNGALPINTRVMAAGDFSDYPVTNNLVFIQSQPVISSNSQKEILPIIDYLFTGTPEPCSSIMVIDVGSFRGNKFESEFLKFEIFRLTGKLQGDFEWNWKDFKKLSSDKNFSIYPLFEQEDIDDGIVDSLNNDTTATGAAITRNFSPETIILLKDKKKVILKSSLKNKVINEFNRILSGTSLIKEESIAIYMQNNDRTNPTQQKRRNIAGLNRRIIENIYNKDIIRKMRREPRLENSCDTVDCIAIMYDSYSFPEPVIKEMNKLFPGQIYDSKTFDMDNLYHIKVMKLNPWGR